MLPIYYEPQAGVFAVWEGQPVNDVVYPLSDVHRMPPETLTAIGLYLPADADPIPQAGA